MSKVLIVNSSPRNNSNSAALAAQVAAGAEEAGHSLSFIDAAKLDIKPCKGCCACITPRSKGCVQRDGMYNEAYPLVREADVIIFASPVYWFNLSGQIKIFIDRLMAVAAPMDENGKRLFASKNSAWSWPMPETTPLTPGASTPSAACKTPASIRERPGPEPSTAAPASRAKSRKMKPCSRRPAPSAKDCNCKGAGRLTASNG